MHTIPEQSLIQFIEYLPANECVQLHKELQMILDLYQHATHHQRRFNTFSLKKVVHYRLFQYRNQLNQELIIKLCYTHRFFYETLDIKASFDFYDVDTFFLESLLAQMTTLIYNPTLQLA